MKKCLIMLAVAAVIISLALCSCGNADKDGISLRVQSLSGDKYMANIILEVTRNDGKPLGTMDYGSAWIEIEGERINVHPTRIYGGEKSNKTAEFLLAEEWDTDISGKNAEIAFENISADGAEFAGTWKTETKLDVDTASLLYAIKPEAACNSDDLIFESVEVTPYSLVVQMKTKFKLDREFVGDIGTKQENGELHVYAGRSSYGGMIPENGNWESYSVQKWRGAPLDIDKETQLVVEDKAYLFSEIATLDSSNEN